MRTHTHPHTFSLYSFHFRILKPFSDSSSCVTPDRGEVTQTQSPVKLFQGSPLMGFSQGFPASAGVTPRSIFYDSNCSIIKAWTLHVTVCSWSKVNNKLFFSQVFKVDGGGLEIFLHLKTSSQTVAERDDSKNRQNIPAQQRPAFKANQPELYQVGVQATVDILHP